MGWGLRMPCVLALSLTARRPSGVFGPRLVRFTPFLELIGCNPFFPHMCSPLFVRPFSCSSGSLGWVTAPRFHQLVEPAVPLCSAAFDGLPGLPPLPPRDRALCAAPSWCPPLWSLSPLPLEGPKGLI